MLKNINDNSFFPTQQRIGYAEGLTKTTYYHKNNKELGEKLFLDALF